MAWDPPKKTRRRLSLLLLTVEVLVLLGVGGLLTTMQQDYEERKATVEVRNQVYEDLDTALIIVGEDGLISDWNHAAECLLGWKAAEVVGKSGDFLIPAEVRDHYHSLVENPAVQAETQRQVQQFCELVPRKTQAPLRAEVAIQGMQTDQAGFKYVLRLKPCQPLDVTKGMN